MANLLNRRTSSATKANLLEQKHLSGSKGSGSPALRQRKSVHGPAVNVVLLGTNKLQGVGGPLEGCQQVGVFFVVAYNAVCRRARAASHGGPTMK